MAITINTTSISITNYKRGMWKKFLSTLSVWDTYPNGGKYVSYQAYILDEENNVIYIHRGYPIDELLKYFPDHEVRMEVTPDPYKHIKLKMKSKPRDEKQKKCIDYLLGINEYEDFAKLNQKFVCMKPGDGKTYCAIEYTVRKGLMSIIIVNNNKILEQWKQSYLNFTDIDEKEIFIISGSSSIRKLMKQTNLSYKVYLASHRTLSSFTSEDLTLMGEVFSKIGIGVKIFDEAHIEWKNIFNIDLYTDIMYNIYLTATPSRSNYSENLVYKRMFSEIPVYGLEESKSDEKYHRIIYCNWNSRPLMKDKVSFFSNHGFDNNKYNDYLLNHEDFFRVIDELVDNFLTKDSTNKIAIVVNCNNMIEKLADYLKEIYPDKTIGMFCGLIANKKLREQELEKDIILATIKGFNAGVDVKGLNILINTVNFSSETICNQLSGRLRFIPDKKSYFVDIVDQGLASECKFQYSSRQRFLSKIALKQFSMDDSTI